MAVTGEPQQLAERPKHFDLGTLTGLVAVLAAFAYGTGVVASNTYLHGLGITDFSFAKPKLLLTGTLVLATFVLLASAPIFIAWSHCAAKEGKLSEKPRSRQMLIVGILALAVLVVATILLCSDQQTQLGEMRAWWIWEHLTNGSRLGKGWAVPVIVLAVFTPGCLASFFAFKAKHLWAHVEPEDDSPCIPLECFHFTGAIAMVLLSIVGYIMIFTFVFYPSVPVEFGGGKPYFVSFAISDDQICQLQQIGIPFDGTLAHITKPLPVLHETDTDVAVWLEGQKGPREKADGASAPAANADSESSDPGKDSSGLGESHFVVVELDQRAIVGSRAYPHWKIVPALDRSSTGCKVGAASAAGLVSQSKSEELP